MQQHWPVICSITVDMFKCINSNIDVTDIGYGVGPFGRFLEGAFSRKLLIISDWREANLRQANFSFN